MTLLPTHEAVASGREVGAVVAVQRAGPSAASVRRRAYADCVTTGRQGHREAKLTAHRSGASRGRENLRREAGEDERVKELERRVDVRRVL